MLSVGNYQARLAKDKADLERAQTLRHLSFHGTDGVDRDPYDKTCQHVLIEDAATHELLGCFRMLLLENGQKIGESYSAQFYDLSALQKFEAPLLELGRFCIHPSVSDADVLRLSWAMLTKVVDENGVGLLFGCTSFRGLDSILYEHAFSYLHENHQAPAKWTPKPKANSVLNFADIKLGIPDVKRAVASMPALMRTYVSMGGWVSDHAVVDTHMNTLHVYTGVEVAAIPASRKRLLRALATNCAPADSA